MSNGEQLPKDSKGWLDFAKNIDLKDHKKAAAGIGLALAAGIGIGGYVLSKKHGNKKVAILYGDRHLEEEGVVSMVETGEDGKFAVGVPQDETTHTSEFSMDADGAGIIRPSGEYDPQHESRLKKAREWVVDLLTQRSGDEE